MGWLLGRRACRNAVGAQPIIPMKLSVVIPAYNEVATIQDLLRRVQQVPREKEIIVVDDCSSGGTREQLARLARANGGPRLTCHEQSRGKSAVLRTGFAQATGDVVVVQDADLEYNPNDYARLLQLIARTVTSSVSVRP